ncbi:MAG: hypothetical protein VX768_00755 [Planctomycetota bacterium]|nr:hypothetical protein [Planctomycetota bacterium]
MQNTRHDKLSLLFEQLYDENLSTQEKVVEKIAILDPGLAAELLDLLNADQLANDHSFLEVPANTKTAAFQPGKKSFANLESVGKYQLGKQVGSGGMGIVHEAFDPVTN